MLDKEDIFQPRRLENRPDGRTHQEKILNLVEEKLKIFFNNKKIKARNFDIIPSTFDGNEVCLAFLIVEPTGFFKNKNDTYKMYCIWLRNNSIILEEKNGYTNSTKGKTIILPSILNYAKMTDFIFKKVIEYFKF